MSPVSFTHDTQNRDFATDTPVSFTRHLQIAPNCTINTVRQNTAKKYYNYKIITKVNILIVIISLLLSVRQFMCADI